MAQGLGWDLDRVTEKLTPVISKKSTRTPYLTVKAGQVAGIHHVCRGLRNGKEALKLDLQMFVGAKKPFDKISIRGNPS